MLCLYCNVSPSIFESVARILISISASYVEGNTLPWATDSVVAHWGWPDWLSSTILIPACEESSFNGHSPLLNWRCTNEFLDLVYLVLLHLHSNHLPTYIICQCLERPPLVAYNLSQSLHLYFWISELLISTVFSQLLHTRVFVIVVIDRAHAYKYWIQPISGWAIVPET